jgi:hypothetical protein
MLQLSIVGTIVMCIDVCMYILLRLHENWLSQKSGS